VQLEKRQFASSSSDDRSDVGGSCRVDRRSERLRVWPAAVARVRRGRTAERTLTTTTARRRRRGRGLRRRQRPARHRCFSWLSAGRRSERDDRRHHLDARGVVVSRTRHWQPSTWRLMTLTIRPPPASSSQPASSSTPPTSAFHRSTFRRNLDLTQFSVLPGLWFLSGFPCLERTYGSGRRQRCASHLRHMNESASQSAVLKRQHR